jgi:antitoxin component of RelBE/YafQ-DinJ toxin-antitoxin module
VKDARIQLRVPTALKKWAEEYARRQGLTLTGLIQNILSQMKKEDLERLSEVKVHEF